jgi:hypothetical protein
LPERRQHRDWIPHVLEQSHRDDGVKLRAVERRIEIQHIGSPTMTRSANVADPAGASCRVSTTDTRTPALESDRDRATCRAR